MPIKAIDIAGLVPKELQVFGHHEKGFNECCDQISPVELVVVMDREKLAKKLYKISYLRIGKWEKISEMNQAQFFIDADALISAKETFSTIQVCKEK